MFKKHLSKILSLALVFTLALSTPLTTYANTEVTDDADNKGGGNEGGSAMSSSNSSLAWSQYNQGYRLYIIDQNFVRISPTYDFLYSTPTGIGTGNELYTTRFDGPSSPSGHYRWSIDKLQEWCDSPNSVPTPTKLVGDVRVGNGTEFKQWFFAGQKGSSINVSTGGSSGTSGSSGNTGTGNTPNYPNTTLATEITNHDYFIDSVLAMNEGDYIGVPDYPISYTEYTLIKNLATTLATKYNTYYNTYKAVTGKWLDLSKDDGIGDYQITEDDVKAYAKCKAWEALYKDYDVYTSYAMYIFEYGQVSFDNNITVYSPTDGIIELSRVNTTDNESLLTQSIPLASGGTGGGSGMPAYNLINKENTIKVPGYTRPGDALQDGCYLIVEPITWLHVRTNNGAWDSTSTYEPTKTYGTYWNLASKWVGKGGFYNTIMTKLFNNCLATSSLVTSTTTGKTIQPIDSSNQKQVADSLNYMNNGYGLSMHIYDASDFNNDQDPDPIQLTGDWVLNESEISKPVSTGTNLSDKVIKYTYDCLDNCDGHKYCSHSCNNNCANNNSNCSHKCNLLKRII